MAQGDDFVSQSIIIENALFYPDLDLLEMQNRYRFVIHLEQDLLISKLKLALIEVNESLFKWTELQKSLGVDSLDSVTYESAYLPVGLSPYVEYYKEAVYMRALSYIVPFLASLRAEKEKVEVLQKVKKSSDYFKDSIKFLNKILYLGKDKPKSPKIGVSLL